MPKNNTTGTGNTRHEPERTGRKKTILIADDKTENRQLLDAMLRSAGYNVRIATNGADAFEMLRKFPVDAIISDILMPRMDGFELLRMCRNDARFAKIPFVIYTATYTEKKHEEFALNLGADLFLIKPMEPAIFLAQIREILRELPATSPFGALAAGDPDHTTYLREHADILGAKLDKKIMELEKTNALFRLFFECVAAGNLIITLDGQIVRANPMFQEMTGYSEKELGTRPIVAIIHPEDRDAYIRATNNLINGTVSNTSVELRYVTKNQEIIWVIVTLSLIRDERQIPLNIIIQCQDITRWKRAEEESRKNTE